LKFFLVICFIKTLRYGSGQFSSASRDTQVNKPTRMSKMVSSYTLTHTTITVTMTDHDVMMAKLVIGNSNGGIFLTRIVTKK
jgi:hypothetical protein